MSKTLQASTAYGKAVTRADIAYLDARDQGWGADWEPIDQALKAYYEAMDQAWKAYQGALAQVRNESQQRRRKVSAP